MLLSYLRQRRSAAITLLSGSLVFVGGSLASIPLVDTQGTSLYLLPPQQELPVIAAHVAWWQGQCLLQLGGSLLVTVGFVLVTLSLWAAGSRVMPLVGLVVGVLAEMLWIMIEAFRLGVGVWVTHDGSVVTPAPTFYLLLFRWIEGALFAITVSFLLGALGMYGLAWLTTGGLRRWGGWMLVATACLGVGTIVVAGAALVPPEAAYLVVIVLGVMLLQRPPNTAPIAGKEEAPALP